MRRVIHIRLSGISDSTEPGNVVACTVGGMLHSAKCVKRHGRLITVEIENLCEIRSGTFVRDLFSKVECIMYVNLGGYAELSYMSYKR